MGTSTVIDRTAKPERGQTGRHALRRGEPGADRLATALVVGLPALLAFALCLYELTTRSLWLDEAATVTIASQHGAAFGAALAHDGGNMLGYYALLHVLIGLFGSGSFVLRFPSAVAAGATVALVGALGLRLFGRRAALIAGLLAAVSLSLVYWGQDARGYVPMIALITGSFLAFVSLLGGRRPWAAGVAYVVLTTAAVYAGLEAALIVPAQLVALVWRRERWRAVLAAVAAVAACCVPLAVLAVNRGSGQLFWVPPPSLRVLHQVAEALASSGLQPNFYTSTGTALLVLTLAALAAGAVRALGPSRCRAASDALPGMLVLSWLLVPALVALLESALGQSIFQARYLLVSLPAVSLLLGWTLAEPWLPRLMAIAAVLALLVLRALQLAPAYGVSPENWRGLTAYVLGHSRSGDCVAFYPLDNRNPFHYYLTRTATPPRPILPALPWSRAHPFIESYATLPSARVARLPGECSRVWLVASHEGRVGGPPASRVNYRRFVSLVTGLHHGYPHAQTMGFGARGVVTLTLYSR